MDSFPVYFDTRGAVTSIITSSFYTARPLAVGRTPASSATFTSGSDGTSRIVCVSSPVGSALNVSVFSVARLLAAGSPIAPDGRNELAILDIVFLLMRIISPGLGLPDYSELSGPIGSTPLWSKLVAERLLVYFELTDPSELIVSSPSTIPVIELPSVLFVPIFTGLSASSYITDAALPLYSVSTC